LPDDVVPKSQRAGAESRTRETIANLRSDLAYLRRQQHELRSRFHGELAVLALRIEDNERRAMRRRKVARLWAVLVLVAAWLWLGRDAVLDMLSGPILLPGLIVVGVTLLAAITVVVLLLHNAADEQEHRDRHQNWFRLTERD
jgi:fatty acid desaturase